MSKRTWPLGMRESIIIAILVAGTTQCFADPKSINFTPTDYEALTKDNKSLTFDKDSDWLPQEIKDNLKTTLEFVLDPKKKKRNTAGINYKDFYHGHIVCPWPCGEEQIKLRDEVIKNMETEDYYFHDFDAEEVKKSPKKANELLTKDKNAAKNLLSKCLSKDCGVVYHTFEPTRPDDDKEMKSNDKRRNLYTPMGGKPEEFEGTEGANETKLDQKYEGKYCLVLQINFLIDKAGAIHVVPHTFRRLNVVLDP